MGNKEFCRVVSDEMFFLSKLLNVQNAPSIISADGRRPTDNAISTPHVSLNSLFAHKTHTDLVMLPVPRTPPNKDSLFVYTVSS